MDEFVHFLMVSGCSIKDSSTLWTTETQVHMGITFVEMMAQKKLHFTEANLFRSWVPCEWAQATANLIGLSYLCISDRRKHLQLVISACSKIQYNICSGMIQIQHERSKNMTIKKKMPQSWIRIFFGYSMIFSEKLRTRNSAYICVCMCICI